MTQKTVNEQIMDLELRVQEALDAFTKAQIERDPLIKFKEDELILLQSELNALRMRRAV
jgi:hypothetical protein